jgi:hypothetical protein
VSADVDAAVERLWMEARSGNLREDVVADVRLVLAALVVAQARNEALADLARAAERRALR